MLLRRATLVAVAIAAIACEPSVSGYNPTANNPSFVDYAVFDPAPDPSDGSPVDIPLPSDLALQPSALATQTGAQLEVLQSFAKQGGWPADQDLGLTFDFVRINIDPATGKATRTAPALDVSTIGPSTFVILSASAAGVGPVAYDAPKAADYQVVGDHGVLTIHKKADAQGLRHYPPATYIAAIRSGPNGVKVTGGVFHQRPAMYLITQCEPGNPPQCVDLTLPENQGLIPGDTREEKAAAAAQLDGLQKAFLQPFVAVQAAMPIKEIGSMTVFTVTGRVRVKADPFAATAGDATALPFPSDFLFKPGTHTLLDQLTSGGPPFGALGPGLATLDGFSTTALMTANTSGLIEAATVNKDSVFLYEYTATGVKRISEISEGPAAHPGWAAASSTLASLAGLKTINIIGLQPAIPVQLPDGSVFPLPPLDDGSEYAVVITDKVTEPGGSPIVQATLGRLTALNNPLIGANGQPTVSGLDVPTATLAESLRVGLKPVLDDLATNKGVTRDHVMLAYTVRTQSGIKTTATGLAAFPYKGANTTVAPVGAVAFSCSAATAALNATLCGVAPTVATTMLSYGVDSNVVPKDSIGYLAEAPIVTFNKLRCNTGDTTCVDTGAFNPSTDIASAFQETINALIAIPAIGPGSCGSAASAGNAAVCTVPLVVFRHGFGGFRGAMLKVANELNKAGFVVAAIDANKHGDRSFCSANNQCLGGTCNPVAGMVNEGDAPGPTPGTCSTDFLRLGDNGCTNVPGPTACLKANPAVSGNFLFSFNLFRSRDTLRQDIIDQSQLIRVLSPNPACDITAAPTDAAHACGNLIFTSNTGVQIDPQKIYFVGQSLGGISGVADAAANPRIKRTTLNVAGATFLDIVSDKNSSLYSTLNTLLAAHDPPLDAANSPSGFLQFVNTAKWVIDPAEPLNFAQHLITDTLSFPAPLNALAPAPATRPTLGQMAVCDGTVTNGHTLELYNLLGLPAQTTTASMTTFTSHLAPSTACPSGGAVNQGFLTDWATYGSASTSITLLGQDDIAGFFAATPVAPPPLRQAP